MAEKIVVIDDDEGARTATVDMLKGLGYEALWAPNVDMGVKLCETSDAVLVITDIMMPGKQGYDLILEMKQKKPSVKILAISGGANGEVSSVLNVASGLGADKCLAKPYGLEELRTAVVETLQA